MRRGIRSAALQQMMRRALAAIALASAALAAAPAAAQFLPDPAEAAMPAERQLLDETLALLMKPRQTPDEVLAALDPALARLNRPTAARGLVQYLRARALSARNRDPAAREAIDESIRLLPGYSGPLLGGAEIYAYLDLPATAADYLVRASELDPETVRGVDEYEIDNILRRLRAQREERRIRLLSERLLEIGWLGRGVEQRSRLALEAIEARVEEGDVAGARTLVTKLLLPQHSRTLLMQNRYRELWPDIERWGGSKLERQWSIYLREAREKWQSSREPARAREYVRALEAAGHHNTLIREMLPLFSSIDPREDYELMFVAPPLAVALAGQGRWDEAEKLFEDAAEAWPLGRDANALNIAANRASHLFHRGRTAAGLAAMDSAIADARRWKGQVNADALATMHHYRACMLHKMGRGGDAALSRAMALRVLGPAAVAGLYLCLDQPEYARQALIAALEQEDLRDEVIGFVQKSSSQPMQSDYGRWLHDRYEALRSDPKLIAEVLKYGRILPFSLSEGAPRQE